MKPAREPTKRPRLHGAVDPLKVIRQLLSGKEFVIYELTIDIDAELQTGDGDPVEMLQDLPARQAAWEMLAAQARHDYGVAIDEKIETENHRFVLYRDDMEKTDREEWKSHLHDETEPTEMFARKRNAERRLAHGLGYGRWRPSFTDDMVRAKVNITADVIRARQKVTAAQRDLNIIEAICTALRTKLTALNHLCALHRSDSRR